MLEVRIAKLIISCTSLNINFSSSAQNTEVCMRNSVKRDYLLSIIYYTHLAMSHCRKNLQISSKGGIFWRFSSHMKTSHLFLVFWIFLTGFISSCWLINSVLKQYCTLSKLLHSPIVGKNNVSTTHNVGVIHFQLFLLLK